MNLSILTRRNFNILSTPKFILIVFILTYSIPSAANSKDTSNNKKIFELSFGSSLLFISDSKAINIHTQHATILPTSAFLFFVEFRPDRKISYPVFLNLPIESKQFIVNDTLINEPSKPVLGFGVQFKLAHFTFTKISKLELEAGPLASFLLTNKAKEIFSPVIAGRFKLIRSENSVMYIGSNYALGINTWGLIFGTGTIF